MSAADPSTPEEWQEAVDAAAGLRAIADCKMYGLLEGGPRVDVARCDEILEHGRARGIFPSRSKEELALGLIVAINQEAAERRQTISQRKSEAQRRRWERKRAEREGASQPKKTTPEQT